MSDDDQRYPSPPGGASPPPPPGYGTAPPPPPGAQPPPAPPAPNYGQPYPPAPPTPNYGQPYPPAPPTPDYGQPYAPAPPFPTQEKKRRWPIVVAVVLVGGLALIGGCVLLIVRFISGPIDAANEFLADVAAQDFPAATAHLDPSCFGAGEATPDALRQFFGESVQSYDLTSASNDNNRTGEAGGTITRAEFGEQSISFSMSKPADDWLVCGFRIGG